MKPLDLDKERRWGLTRAAFDFFAFQNHQYPREAALEWVGNRYNLTRFERDLLGRGVFGQEEALCRRGKRVCGSGWLGYLLAVDGHNVQITVESALLERPLLLANDGALRDLAGQSSKFRISEASTMALDVLFRFLEEFRPAKILFLFDSPMSHSGSLAALYRERLGRAGLKGDARAVAVPEREIPYGDCVVASSDRAVLARSSQWLDLSRTALDFRGPLHLTADFTGLGLVCPASDLESTNIFQVGSETDSRKG